MTQHEQETRPNAAPLTRWLMLASAGVYFVIIANALAEDHLPFDWRRMIGYLLLLAAMSACCWAFGWLQGRKSDRDRL